MATPDEQDTSRDRPERMGIDQGAEAIHGLMTREIDRSEEGDTDPESEEQPRAEEEQAQPESPDAEETAPEAEVDTEELDQAEEAPEDSDEPSDSEEPQTYRVKVAGEEQEVTLDELKGGYQRQADYTRKTQELAEVRKAAQEQKVQYAQLRDQVAQELQFIEQAMEESRPEKPDPELRQEDPARYADQMAAYDQWQEQFEAIRNERQQAEQERDGIRQEQLLRAKQDMFEQLQSEIPGWVDEDTVVEEVTAMESYLIDEYGYEPSDLQQVVDPRIIQIARKAMKYDNLDAKKDELTSKAKNKSKSKKPANLKPGTNADSKKRKKNKDAATQAREKVRKSGSIHDGAEAIHHLLNDS